MTDESANEILELNEVWDNPTDEDLKAVDLTKDEWKRKCIESDYCPIDLMTLAGRYNTLRSERDRLREALEVAKHGFREADRALDCIGLIIANLSESEG